MNPSLLAATVGAVSLAGTFAYVALRWRRAPAAFKAMNYVALISLVAGVAIGASVTSTIFRRTVREEEARERVPGDRSPDSSTASRSAVGLPAIEVSGALTAQDMSRLHDPKWETSSSALEDCRLGLKDSHSLRYTAVFIEVDPRGYHDIWKEHTDLVPYDEVIQFCDSGSADKSSKVCLAAYRFAGKSEDK